MSKVPLHWEEVQGSREVLATGYGGRGFVRRKLLNPNTGGEIEWDFFEEPDYALVFALTELNGIPHVVAVRQFKPGNMDFFLGLPGGTPDVDKQHPEELALEELLEETGYRPSKIIYLGSVFKNISYERTQGHLFLALGCEEVAEQDTGENEETEVVLVPLNEWIDYLDEILDDSALATCYRALRHLGYSLVLPD